jgi:hypothetical protein
MFSVSIWIMKFSFWTAHNFHSDSLYHILWTHQLYLYFYNPLRFILSNLVLPRHLLSQPSDLATEAHLPSPSSTPSPPSRLLLTVPWHREGSHAEGGLCLPRSPTRCASMLPDAWLSPTTLHLYLCSGISQIVQCCVLMPYD